MTNHIEKPSEQFLEPMRSASEKQSFARIEEDLEVINWKTLSLQIPPIERYQVFDWLSNKNE